MSEKVSCRLSFGLDEAEIPKVAYSISELAKVNLSAVVEQQDLIELVVNSLGDLIYADHDTRAEDRGAFFESLKDS